MTCLFDDNKNQYLYLPDQWESGVKQRKANITNGVCLEVGLRIETIHEVNWMEWIAKVGEKGTIAKEPLNLYGTVTQRWWGIRFDNNNSFFLVTPDANDDFLWGWCRPLEVPDGTPESSI